MDALEQFEDRQPGEDPSLSRRLTLSPDVDAFVWPLTNGLCYSTAAGAGCVPTRLLRRNGVVVATSFTSDSPIVQVFGLAAPGIERVEFRLNGTGETVAAEVAAGAFYIELMNDPRSASWTNPDESTGTQKGLVPRP
jgi:hypothetical protein